MLTNFFYTEQMLDCLALSQAGSEEAHFTYKSQITHLTRRLFHLLVRCVVVVAFIGSYAH